MRVNTAARQICPRFLVLERASLDDRFELLNLNFGSVQIFNNVTFGDIF